jgi:hypothetical protein
MRIHHPLTAMLLAALLHPHASGAQSLADVARAEEARRKSIKTTSPTYTNAELKGRGDTSPFLAPTAAVPPTPAEAEKPKVDEAGKEEKQWRDRMTALRSAVARNKVLEAALESRVNALTTDFMNRSDPAQRATVEQDRKTAAAEMNRVKQDTVKQNAAMVALEDEARKANIPAGWLR